MERRQTPFEQRLANEARRLRHEAKSSARK